MIVRMNEEGGSWTLAAHVEPQRENDSMLGIYLSGFSLFVAPDCISEAWRRDWRGIHKTECRKE